MPAVGETQDLSIRPELGEIVLTDGVDAATRFGIVGDDKVGAQFQEGDKLGAAIMDKPTYTSIENYWALYNGSWGKNSKLGYTIVDYFSSNSAFTNHGENIWKLDNDQPLVEGNYLFYAPYDASKPMRSQLEVRVPTVQDASTEKKALQDYYTGILDGTNSGRPVDDPTPDYIVPAVKNVVKVGYQFLAYENGAAQKASTTLHDLMAYPKFTIKNNFKGYLLSTEDDDDFVSFAGGTITVKKVELYSTSNVPVGGLLENVKLATLGTTIWKTPFDNLLTDVLATGSSRIERNLITTVNINRDVELGKDLVFYAVMPSLAFVDEQLYANVYVSIDGKDYTISTADMIGALVDDQLVVSYSGNRDIADLAYRAVTLTKGQKYPQEELDLDLENKTLTAKAIAGKSLTLNLVGGFVTAAGTTTLQVAKGTTDAPGVGPKDYITDNTEFINYFKELFSNSALLENTSLVDFDRSEPVFRFDAGNNNKVTINSELIDALSSYNNSGSLTLTTALPIANDVTITAIDGNEVTFKSKNNNSFDITFNGGNYGVDANYVVSNGKSVHVKSGTWAPAQYANDASIGNVLIYSGATATLDVANNKKLTASIVNKGTLNVQGGKFVNGIENNGTINLTGTVQQLNVNAGNGKIVAEKSYASNDVTVTGGATQNGVYVASAFDKYDVTDAEKLTWVTTFKYTSAVSLTEESWTEIAAQIVDIKKYEIDNWTFAEGTYDMKGITTIVNGGGITGGNVDFTVVSNWTLNNSSNTATTITNITIDGTFSGKKTLVNAVIK